MFSFMSPPGMYGKDDFEQFRSDMVVGCAEDMLQATFKSTQGSDEEKVQSAVHCHSQPVKIVVGQQLCIGR